MATGLRESSLSLHTDSHKLTANDSVLACELLPGVQGWLVSVTSRNIIPTVTRRAQARTLIAYDRHVTRITRTRARSEPGAPSLGVATR